MKKKSTLMVDSFQRAGAGYSKMLITMCCLALLLATLIGACKKDNYKGEVIGVCPLVVSTDPMDKAVDVALNKAIGVTFNTSMSAATINKTTFSIKQGSTVISGTVGPTTNGATFTFTPDVPLLPFTTYTGTITTAATDTLRTALVNDYVWSFTTSPQVALSANPAIGGVVVGAGTFAQGSVTTVTATPNTGYTFTNWTDNGVIASISSSYQFTMAGNRTLVANFTAIPVGRFAVTLTSLPVAGGTTSGSGSYVSGSVVTVTAAPNTGYTFVNWTENGNLVSVSPSFQFPIAGNRTLIANFKVIPASQFSVVLSSNPPAGGTTSGSGSYTAGSSVTVTAIQNTGYTFANWTENGNIVSTTAAFNFPLSASRVLVANFTINTYTLNVAATNGTTVKTPSQTTYSNGTTVQVSATPNTGYVFSGWSGDATGSANPLTVTMDANKNITANFTPIYTLNVTAVNGTVVANPNLTTYNSGATVTLTATAKAGYTFTSWTGDATGNTNPLTVTMNANKNITANFSLTPAIGPVLPSLGGAANFTILTKASITTTGATVIGGNIGVSPAAASSIAGFGLIMNSDLQSSHTPIVGGLVYAADYATPTPANLTVAVSDMATAYTAANGLVTPAPKVDLYAGNVSGKILVPGLYKYNTALLINSPGVTLDGGPNDTWIFQISQDLTVNDGALITLTGGAQAKNVFWVVAGQATLGTNVDFSGNILSKTLISLKSGTKVTGRLLAQTSVTLIANTVVLP